MLRAGVNIEPTMESSGWLNTVKVFSGWFRGEIKTPLGFFYKLLTVCGIIVVFGLFARAPTWLLVSFTVLIFLAFFTVALLTSSSPRKLVYGELGYRKEMELAYGTETRQLSPQDVITTPGEPAPTELVEGSKLLSKGTLDGN